MKANVLKPIVGALALVAAAHAAAQITFYEDEGFRGRAFTHRPAVRNFERPASTTAPRRSSSSAAAGKSARTRASRAAASVLRRGSYDSLRGLGLNNRDLVGAPGRATRGRYDNEAPQPLAAPAYEYRRRPNERRVRSAGHVGARGRRPAGAALLGRAPAGGRAAPRPNVAGGDHRRRDRRHPRPPGRRRHAARGRDGRRRRRRRGARRERRTASATARPARTCSAARTSPARRRSTGT